MRLVHTMGAVLLIAACGGNSGDQDGGGTGDAGDIITGLTIDPASAELVVRDAVAATQDYTVTATFADGHTEEVSGYLFVEDAEFGLISSAGVFTTSGAKAGTTLVTAVYEGATAQSNLTVRIENRRVDPAVDPDASTWFDSASTNAALNPTLAYPAADTLVPPNLGDFDVHWRDSAGANLFEVRMSTDYLDIRVYVEGTPNAGSWIAFLPTEWAVVGNSARGATLDVSVRAMNDGNNTEVSESATLQVRLADEDIDGGLYYWTTAGGPAGVWRHDMSKPGQPPEEFYTTNQAPNGKCVGCHAMSKDGSRMAVRYDGGHTNSGSVVDIATGTEVLPVDGTYKWSYAALTTDGKQMVFTEGGALTHLDVDNQVATAVTTTNSVSHPDFSPDETQLVYAAYGSGNPVWFSGGSIVVRSYDVSTGAFGDEQTLVDAVGQNNYYPSFSPDGEWLLFNRSGGDTYNDADAELWVVKTDGTGEPIKLDTPNVANNLTNSMPRWAPFETTYTGEGTSEPLFWLTWSSMRQFGARVNSGTRPQIWMAPFRPAQAIAGNDPSGPAFWLPFQDIATNNHIAQWTETIVETPQTE